MKQENVKKLTSLVANYVNHELLDAAKSIAALEGKLKRMEFIDFQRGKDLQDIRNHINSASIIISMVNDCTKATLTEKQKSEMYWNTVHALNAGNEEADRCAFEIRLKALCSGDDDLINAIEYLHEVI